MKIGEESEKIEFKKSTGEKRESMEAICCILNKHCGGELYYGVEDNGEVVGQTVTDSTIRDVAAWIYEAIEPRIIATVEKLTFEGKQIIKVTFSGHRRPYSVYGDFLTRVGTTKKKMTAEELKRLFEHEDYASKWEEETTQYGINDLDAEVLRQFYERAKGCGRLGIDDYDETKILSSVGLIEGKTVLKGGYALFGKKADIHLKLATFATPDKVTFLDLKLLTGNIFKLLDIAVEYINQRLNYRIDIGEKERIEKPEIPVRAIREIVANAFAHANYENLPEIEVNVHPDKIVIYNPGSFPDEYTPQDFVEKNIHSYKRNGKIFDALYMSKNCEKSGTGFQRVAKLCSESGVHWDYQKEAAGFTFVFFRGTSVLGRAPVEGLSALEESVLSLIRDIPGISKSEMASRLGKSEKTIQRAIASLLSKRAINRIGSNKAGYWEVA